MGFCSSSCHFQQFLHQDVFLKKRTVAEAMGRCSSSVCSGSNADFDPGSL